MMSGKHWLSGGEHAEQKHGNQQMIRIRDWDDTFENAYTRKVSQMRYFCCPVDLCSTGYLTLMSAGQRGAAAFGVFVALCQYSATFELQRRGCICRKDGRAIPLPLLASAISVPLQVLEDAMQLLMSEDIAWLIESHPSQIESNSNKIESQSNQIESSASKVAPSLVQNSSVQNSSDNGIWPDLFIPSSMDTPQVRQAFADWCRYLTAKAPHKIPDEISIEVFWKQQLKRGPSGFVAAVGRAIECGWLNLRDDEQGSNGTDILDDVLAEMAGGKS